jgi:arylsulfatase A-like enzyme
MVKEDIPSMTLRNATAAIVVIASWMGLATGLVEGVGWLVLQRLGRLTQLGTDVIWIAPVLDCLVLVAVGLVVGVAYRLMSDRLWWPMALFAVGGAAAINFVSLTLGTYVYRWVLVIVAAGLAVTFVRLVRHREERAVSFFRRTLPVLGVVVLLTFLGLETYQGLRERSLEASLGEAEAGEPDVLVLVVDALRADHLSSYGYERNTSPFLDELAADGVLFQRAISASSYSLPSHASLLSGLYPNEHGVEWLEFKVFEDAPYPSIAEAMYERGYRTGAFSANPFWFTREQGFGRGFIRFEDYYHSIADMFYRTVFGNNFTTVKLLLGFDQVPARKLAPESTDRVLDWVLADDRPFFAFVNYFDVHAPYTPPQPYRSRFSELEAPGGILNWLLERQGDTYLTPAERQSEIDGYDGAIAFVDDEIARLVERLRTARPDHDLLIVLTSDHGEAFGEHGGYLHARSLYREELHVPLIVHGPGVPSGVRIDRPVTQVALPATILDLVSDGAAATLGSPSLTTLWADQAAAGAWPYPLAEAGERDWASESFPMHHGDMKSLFTPDLHFIAHETLPDELYAWADVNEKEDLAEDPRYTTIVGELSGLLPPWSTSSAEREFLRVR